MAFTFNSSHVGSSGLATVRFLTGEVSSGTAVLSDETINAVLTNITSNHRLAAIYCADSLTAYYARTVDTRNEGLDVKGSDRSKHYRELSVSLRLSAYAFGGMYVGGRSKDEKNERQDDSDLVQSFFERDIHDFPGSVASSTEV